MNDIDLGFAEQRESAWLTNRYFPSKVGGKPAWLELEKLPSNKELLCEKCQQSKAFLCQVKTSRLDICRYVQLKLIDYYRFMHHLKMSIIFIELFTSLCAERPIVRR